MSAFTPGPWRYRRWAQDDANVAELESLGLSPTPLRMNDGSVPVMSDTGRVALVDCHTQFKRGQGYDTECSEREANARLIAAAPDLLAVTQAFVANIDERYFEPEPGDRWYKEYVAAKAALAKAVQP